MKTYIATCAVPRSYIDVTVLTEGDQERIGFWGAMASNLDVEQKVDKFSVNTLGFLHSPAWDAEDAIDLHNFDLKKMNIKFKFECDAEDPEAAGDWLEAKLEEKLAPDWHIDDVDEA